MASNIQITESSKKRVANITLILNMATWLEICRSSLHNDELDTLAQRWEQLTNRIQLYSNLDNYERFNTWLSSEALSLFLLRIKNILLALQETASLPNNDERQQIEKLLIRATDLEMNKVELKLHFKLSKDQDLLRTEPLTWDLIREKRARLEQEFIAQQFSQKFQANNILLPIFKKYERRRISIKKQISRLRHAAEISDVGNYSTGILRTLQTALPTVVGTLGFIGNILQAVPAIGAITAAAPIALKAIRDFIKSKSYSKKFIALAIVGIVVGGIATAGLVTVATAGIACAFIGLGVGIKFIKPVIQTMRLINQREQQLIDYQKRLLLLDANKAKELLPIEKHMLFKKIELYCLNNDVGQESLRNLKKVIHSGNLRNIEQHVLIQAAIHPSSVQEILATDTKQRLNEITNDLIGLRAKRNKQMVLAVNGCIAVVGAILICIPTPPTMILGAALLLATSIVNIAVKYDWLNKAKSRWDNLFSKQATKTMPPEFAPSKDHTLVDQVKLTRSSSEPTLTSTGFHLTKRLARSSSQTSTAAESLIPAGLLPASAPHVINDKRFSLGFLKKTEPEVNTPQPHPHPKDKPKV